MPALLQGSYGIATAGPRVVGSYGILFGDESIEEPTSPPTLDGTQLLADYGIDTSVVDAARPRAGPVPTQMVGYRIEIGGVVIPPGSLIPPVVLTEELGSGSTLTLRLPVGDETGLFVGAAAPGPVGIADFWATLGAPAGMDDIDVWGLYVTPTRLHELPLMLHGALESARISGSPAGRFLELVVVDTRVRWDRRPITYVLPPGHGRTRLQVVREMAIKAGVPPSQISLAGPSQRMRRGVQVVDGQLWGVPADLMHADGYVLDVDRRGRLVNRPRVRTSGRVDMVLRETDLLSASADATTDGPTRITLTSTIQTPSDERACGLDSKVRVVESFGVYAPPVAVQRQAINGVLSAYAATPSPPSERVITRTTLTQLYDCDTLIGSEVYEEGWHNLIAWRYELETDGTIRGYNPAAYLFDSGVADDDTQAYRLAVWRFGGVSRVVVAREFDGRDFLVRIVTRKYGSVLRRAAVKDRTLTSVAWADRPYIQDQEILADGTGVADGGEVLAGVATGAPGTRTAPFHGSQPSIQEEEVVEYSVTDEGYILAEDTRRYAWDQRRGATEYYADETSSGSDSWRFDEVEHQRVTYLEAGAGLAQRVTSRSVRGTVEPTVTEDLDGYLPEAERRGQPTIVTPDATAQELAEYAEAASRFEAVPIKCAVISAALEATRQRQEQRREAQWAESEQDLCSQAMLDLLEGSPIDAQATAPTNYLLRAGGRVRLRYRQIGLDHDVHVTSATPIQDNGPSQPLLTEIAGRIYVA